MAATTTRTTYRRPATTPDTPCLHCGQAVRSYPRRGLCKSCYDQPRIRKRYPYTGCLSRLNGRPVADRPGTSGAAAHAGALPTVCHAEPGSAQKIAALCQRYECRQSLFHPDEPSLPLPGRRIDRSVWEAAVVWRVLGLHDPSILELLCEVIEETAARFQRGAQRCRTVRMGQC